MERRRWVRPAIRWAFTAFLVALFNLVGSSANADFYNPETFNLPSDEALYFFADQSASGDVIATANGCDICFMMDVTGYGSISKNGGSTFTEVTSIGKQEWRAVEVSSDGNTIVFFASRYFFVSTNGGNSFTRVDPLTPTQIFNGVEISNGALSGDGKSIFFLDRTDGIYKVTYKSNLRMWTTDLNIVNFNGNDAFAIATNYDGSKTYIASYQCSITRLTGSTLTLLLNTVSYYSQCLSWQQIRTSDSGNEFIGIALVDRGATVFISNNGGSSLSVLTQVDGTDLEPATSVEISPDGNNSFFTTYRTYSSFESYGHLYTKHGKTSNWVTRGQVYEEFRRLRADNEGSNLIAVREGYDVKIFKAKPGAPLITAGSIASPSSFSITWAGGFDPGSDPLQAITDVIIEYATSSSGPWTVFNDGVSGGSSGTITVTGLTPQVDYYFRIKSRNSFGTSSYSGIQTGSIYGKPGTPAAPVKLNINTESKAHLYFSQPTSSGGAPELTETQWQYSTNGGSIWNDSSTATFSAVSRYDGTIGAPILIVAGHTPGQALLFRSRTSNGLVWSDWSPSTSVTLYNKVLAPSNFQVNATSTTSTLSWSVPSDLGGETIAYYRYKFYGGSNVVPYETTTSLSAVINGLQQGISYDYEVMAVTTRGTISFSSFVYGVLTAKPPTKLGISQTISGAKSGSAFVVQPAIGILAADNSRVTTDSSTVVYAQIDLNGRLIGRDSATAVNGLATFSNLGIRGVAGETYAIYFYSGSLTYTATTVVLQPGNPATMRFTQKSIGGKVGTTFSQHARIELLDGDGNRVTWDDTTTVTISTSSGFITSSDFTYTRTAVDGLASFSGLGILGGAGSTAVLSYSATGLTSIQETITVTTGAASKFVRVIRAQDGFIGGKFGVQPTYQILDAADNIVTDGEYYVSIASNIGVLTGQTIEKSVNGLVSFKNLGIKDVTAGRLAMLSVYSLGFTTYTGDSIVTRQSRPQLSWSDFYIPRGLAPFTIPSPDSNTAGSFTYTSSNSGVISISGNTATVGNSGTATITATFTPTDTSSFSSGETITATFTVNPGTGTLIVAISGGATASKGVVKTMTATASDAGSVTFFINGKRVAGCVGIKTQSSVATCNWKPTNQGSVTITALLLPTNSQISPVTASAVNLNIGRRTGRR